MEDNIIAGIILVTFSFCAMCAYAPVVYVLFKLWRESKNHFNLLLLSLALSDNIQLLLYCGYAAPSTFLSRPLYGYEADALVFGTLNNMSYFSGLALLVNIGMNRYWSVCRKSTYKVTYTMRAILASVAACFAFGIVSAIPQLTPCCPLRYWQDSYSFGYDMDTNAPYVWYDRSVTTVTFVSGGFIYAMIFLRIRSAKMNLVHTTAASQLAEQRRERTNKRLAIQSAAIFGLMFLAGLGFTIIPLLTSDKWWALMSAVILICAFGVQPVIYLIFNKPIQQKIMELLPCKKGSPPASGTQNNHVNTVMVGTTASNHGSRRQTLEVNLLQIG